MKSFIQLCLRNFPSPESESANWIQIISAKLSRIQARTAGSSLSKDCAFTHLSLPLNGFHSLYSERRVPTHSLHYQSRVFLKLATNVHQA
ncbi:hypothetical protein T4B_4138 [Trichinella pseudospiralis]|uniref:Uncharacterized protein n=1 Tax=Trichinella pseudospiralis TaxID=6337 RepID=A0A0V1K5L7_TRIPS|nr:hypothetical protein T4B_4138 [Trichinella pseudospiralis]KRZ42422.1 hypothetical protein T4C_694 [Trichinella pseudospiralis]